MDAILTAGAQVLGHAGMDAMSTDRVAEVAGVSIGTLYQYFPNKESIVVGVAERELERMAALLGAYVARLGTSPEAVAESYVRAMTEAHAREAPLHRVLVAEIPRLADHALVRAHNARCLALVRAFLAQALGEGGRDLDALAYVLVHATRGVTVARLDDPPAGDGEAVTRELIALVRALLRAPG